MRYGRNSRRVVARLGIAALMSSAVVGLSTAAVVVGSSSPAVAAASCTFNGQASVVTGVTAGGVISVSCSGMPAKLSILMVETSAVSGLVSSANQTAEADIGALQGAKSNSSGNLATSFHVPSPYADADPNGVCPPTQAQVNAGEVGCLLSVADPNTQISYGTVTLQYAGQPTPQTPALSFTPTVAGPGQQITFTGGGGWWGSAGAVTALSSANISIGGVPPANTSASISAASYNYSPPSPLVAPTLSGSFVVPCGVPAGTPNVTVTEANTTGIPGTVSASAPITSSGSGTKPAITSINPTTGNPTGDTTVTITGCNFTGVTKVMFGNAPAVSFTVNSDTQITAIAPPGSGLVDVVLTGPGGTSPISIATQFGYGAQGYTLAGTDGAVYNFGSAYQGSLTGSHIKPFKPVVGVSSMSNGTGYWLAGGDGGVFAFGSASFHGSLAGRALAKPVVGITAKSDGTGYWLAGGDGGVFAFGSASFHGSLAGRALAQPIVGIASTPDGNGYWLVGGDGGVFAFGTASFHGSLAGHTLAKPIVGIASAPDGNGYWLVGADGGVFAFGSATFHGSVPGLHLSSYKPIVGIVSPDSGGYDVIGSDGGIYTFGDAPFAGGTAGKRLSAPIVGGASV